MRKYMARFIFFFHLDFSFCVLFCLKFDYSSSFTETVMGAGFSENRT